MPLYYLDVESEGEDPQQDRLISVQVQPLADDLRPTAPMTVLTEWEWGEKEMVRSAISKGIFEETWDFVPVGNRLRFDLTFLLERARHHALLSLDPAAIRRFWFNKPMLDIGSVLILMNGGKFDGSSIANFVQKGASAEVPMLYRQGKHGDILAYVREEGDATLALLGELRSMLTTFGERKRRQPEPGRGTTVGKP